MNKLVLWLTVVALVVGFTLGVQVQSLTAPPQVQAAPACSSKPVLITEFRTIEYIEYVPVFYPVFFEVDTCAFQLSTDKTPDRDVEYTSLKWTKNKNTSSVTEVEIEINTETSTETSEPECEFGNPGNLKCVGRAGETPNGKDGWNFPPGVRGRSD
jgi:hypothetical protein